MIWSEQRSPTVRDVGAQGKRPLSLSLSLSRERPYLLASVVESGHLQYGFSLKTEATVGGRKHAWES